MTKSPKTPEQRLQDVYNKYASKVVSALEVTALSSVLRREVLNEDQLAFYENVYKPQVEAAALRKGPNLYQEASEKAGGADGGVYTDSSDVFMSLAVVVEVETLMKDTQDKLLRFAPKGYKEAVAEITELLIPQLTDYSAEVEEGNLEPVFPPFKFPDFGRGLGSK